MHVLRYGIKPRPYGHFQCVSLDLLYVLLVREVWGVEVSLEWIKVKRVVSAGDGDLGDIETDR